MFIKKLPVKAKNDKLISIVEAHIINGVRRDIVYEKLGYLSEIKENHKDYEKYLQERLEFHKSHKRQDENLSYMKKIDFSIRINEKEKISSIKNGGALFLNKIWADLKLESFFNKWKYDNKKKIKYSMNDMMRLLSYSRIINPGSKLHDSNNIHSYIEDFDLTIDNIYDALDEINTFSNKLTRKLSSSCKEIFSNKGNAIYYDCTNFYFEIQNEDEEDGLRAYGVEKNHRPDPIIEYGLLFAEEGYPIGSCTFRGNHSETNTLVPLLKEAGENASDAKIICADAGLNTTKNKKTIHQTGRNYIFVQPIKKLEKCLLNDLLDKKGMIYYGEADKEGRKKSYKSRWLNKKDGLEERIIIKFDPAQYDFMIKTIEKRVEHANKIIKNPSSLNLSKCKDGKEYIGKISTNENGEIIKEKSNLILLEDKIEKEKLLAGFYAYVTDIPSNSDNDEEYREELKKNDLRCVPLDDIEILQIAGKRVEIEDCFRVMKTDMQARPIYVRKPEHIKAHMFTVYLALTLICILKKKYGYGFTNEELFNSLRNYSLAVEDETTYKTLYFDEICHKLKKEMSLDIDYLYISKKTMNHIIAKSKD